VYSQIEFNVVEKTNILSGPLNTFPKVSLQQVDGSAFEPLWDELVRTYHYLGYNKLLGNRLKYLAFIEQHPVAALSWSAPAKRVNVRDRFLGWSDKLRHEFLFTIAANSRFVIFPWVTIPNIGSHILGMNLRCIKKDWLKKFKKELLLVETFVDPSLFKGTVYKASNWKKLGSTKGYTKQGKGYIYHGQIKDIYIYILEPDYRQILGVPSVPLFENTLPKNVEKISMLLNECKWAPELLNSDEFKCSDFDLIAQELVHFHHEFADCFCRSEQEEIGVNYLSGLMSSIQKKTAEKIALEIINEKAVRSTQRFMKDYKWDEEAMLHKHQAMVAESLGTEDGMINVDASEFAKKGKNSVGVARQYCGNTGKQDNCQSGVFVGYASEKGHGLLDAQMYMPIQWFNEDHKILREQNLVPENLTFKTKNKIANDLITAVHKKISARWIGCDASFGGDINFLNSLPDNLYYFADVKANSKVFLEKPEVGIPPYSGRGKRPTKPQVLSDHQLFSVSQLETSDKVEWKVVNLGEGSKGPLLAHVACLRVYPSRDGLPQDEPVWLIIRKRTDNQTRHAFSNAPETIDFAELCRASCMRWAIEQCFQECKMHLGMDHYEHRSWPAWHRHMIYVMLAQHFIFRIRQTLKKKYLSLAMVKKLLEVVLPLRSLTREGAIEILNYTLKRNYIAHQSHRKKQVAIAEKLGVQVSL